MRTFHTDFSQLPLIYRLRIAFFLILGRRKAYRFPFYLKVRKMDRIEGIEI